MKKKPADPDALLKRMAGLCAKSEQCSFDIDAKLYRAGLPKDKRVEIIDWLTANRYLDDARFARAFADDKVRFSGWGKRKIRMALAAKRIPSPLIASALDSVDDEDYAEALGRVLAAARRDVSVTVGETPTYEQKAKIYRKLLARGFESELIGRLL